jgi:hypoxanthine phosphoribosyltransferase
MSKLTMLYSHEQIATRVKELADTLSRDYTDKELVVVGVLKGGAIFLADLVRRLDLPLIFDFVTLSSYGSGKDSSQQVRLTTDLHVSLEGAHLLVVDDIIDTGISAAFLCQYLEERRPASLKTCFLIDKSQRRQVEITPDYIGFKLDRGFVVGYGMDYSEKYRNLPDIYRLD